MLGSVLSLCAAFFWAGAVIMFKKSGETFSPISLNIYKSLVALILLSITMLLLKVPFIPDKPVNDWLLLAASGFIGITLSDILFFMALNRLGAGVVAIVECFYLPSVIFFSFIILGEHLSIGTVIGGLMVLAAIFVGSMKKKEIPGKENKNIDDEDRASGAGTSLSGIIIGVFSMIFVAIGIVIIKELLDRTGVLWATTVRISAAVVSLMILMIFLPKRRQYLRELKFSKAWFTAFPASVAGNFLALLCWVGGMKYTSASRAAVLNQMSTIFIFILAAIFLKEKITANKSIAILLAISGACLTIFT